MNVDLFMVGACSLAIGAIVGLLAAGLTVAARSSLDGSDATFDGALDAGRINWLDQMKCNLVWNAHHVGWAVIDENNRFVAAGKSPRAAIDRARAVVTKEAAPNG